MTTDSFLDALEICLQALEEGADIESCLVLYPDLAHELRPILVTALQAHAAAVTDVPVDMARRGRVRVLQVATEMREQQSAMPVLRLGRKRSFFGARFYRLAVTTSVVVAFLLTGGTGLVNASNGALPGDRLYPVKRSWEDVRLALVLNAQTKAALEHQFDQERVQEIEALYSEKRTEQVNFQGVVESQQTGTWRIAGLIVAIDEETATGAGINSGATVRIVGETDDGVIKAGKIILVATPGVTPTAVSTSTPGLQISPTGTPEESQSPEAGEDSGSIRSTEAESPKSSESSGKSDTENETDTNSIRTPRPDNGTGSSAINTPHPRRDDSGSTHGSGGDNRQPTQSSTGDSGSGSDNNQPSPDDSGGGDH